MTLAVLVVCVLLGRELGAWTGSPIVRSKCKAKFVTKASSFSPLSFRSLRLLGHTAAAQPTDNHKGEASSDKKRHCDQRIILRPEWWYVHARERSVHVESETQVSVETAQCVPRRSLLSVVFVTRCSRLSSRSFWR